MLENTAIVTAPPSSVPFIWRLNHSQTGTFRITDTDPVGSMVTEFELSKEGDLTITGSLTTGSSSLPDFVFRDDYPLMPLEELEEFIATNKHLPRIPSDQEVQQRGGRINMSDLQLRLLEKIEELTLYTLEQQRTIMALSDRLAELEGETRDKPPSN